MTSPDPTTAPRRVLLVAHTGRDDAREVARAFAKALTANGLLVRLLQGEAADLGLAATDNSIEVVTEDVSEDCELVVVIGGVGSFPGAILGGLIAGEIISITSMFNPGYSYVVLFVAMTLVLALRPYGLLGTAGRE